MGGYHKMEERAFRLLNSIQVVLEITLDDRPTIVFAGNTNNRARPDGPRRRPPAGFSQCRARQGRTPSEMVGRSANFAERRAVSSSARVVGEDSSLTSTMARTSGENNMSVLTQPATK
jgi:hypothetical protein